jgi:MinD-like ATPase involved in chromosome partitioning or flagellar assembly
VYTITFYSFKGGVGRTLALVNVAAQLARMGRKVLLVDFDLEAPGLETFERLRPPQPHPGLVEYVTEYMRTKRSPDVRDYIYSPPPGRKMLGQLWVMPAGRRDASYQAALTRLNWKKLYDDCEGFLFFEDMKAQWEQELKPDYVLIDSRTGHTDVKGICTRQLPDVVVVLFFPNEQNLVGLKAVCQEIRSEREHGLMKNIGLHFVMSNVPDLDDEDKVLHRRLKAFEKELGIRKLSAVIHRYESVMLFNQAIFVLDRPKSRLAREYRKLTRELIRYNPADREGALQFLHRYNCDDVRDADRLWGDDEKMVDQGLPAGKELFNKIQAHFFDDPDMIFEMATCYLPDEADAEGREKLLDQVLMLRPDHPEALIRRGTVADLFQYLQDQGLDSRHGFHALYRLRAEVPERLSEAIDCAIARGIATESKFTLAKFLAETEAVLPRAIQFMRDYLADESNPDRKATATFYLQSYLIRAQRWAEVMSVYDHKADPVGEVLSLAELFNIGMALWAQSGAVPEGVSEEIRQRLGQNESVDQLGEYGPLVGWPEGECWCMWWRGDAQAALGRLMFWMERIEKWLKDRQHSATSSSWWSFWRYRGVQLSEYRDDCEQLRRMIQGEPIRPPFLGDSAQAREVPNTLGVMNSNRSA